MMAYEHISRPNITVLYGCNDGLRDFYAHATNFSTLRVEKNGNKYTHICIILRTEIIVVTFKRMTTGGRIWKTKVYILGTYMPNILCTYPYHYKSTYYIYTWA